MSYQIQHNRRECIGCGACAAVAPEHWEMNADGKSDCKNSKKNEKEWEIKDIADADFEINKEAAEACPVNVIHIVDKDKKQII
ncbi:ferredoxin [Candidatus Woesearchaeota archaeon]|nr:MAG: ferredoxin [Candidatus Woesearchaeota archaeon]